MAELMRGKAEVLSAMREVASLAQDAGARSLAASLFDERIPKVEQERFHLVVLGEFNHGKTTFVNALLGRPILPMGVTPTTALIHHIEHGKEPQARVVSESGEERALPVGELEGYVVGGAAAADGVAHVELSFPSPLLAEGIVLVDTPGVNDLNLQRAEITYGYVPRADAVLFLLDAGQILKESERSFIQSKLLAASRDKLIFVINKIDLLDEDERREAVAYATKHLSALVPNARVFPLSAEQALEGDRDGSGLAALVTELERFLAEERGRVLLDNALDSALRAAGTLRTSIEVRKRALSLDATTLEGRLSALERELGGTSDAHAARERKIREDVAALKALVRSEVEGFGKRFALALPQEIDESKADDLRRYLPGFLEERLRQHVEAQAEVVGERLERIAEEAIAFVSQDAAEREAKLREVLGDDAAQLDLKVNTFAYDVGVFALGAFGITIMALSNVLVGGAMALAAPVLAWVFRGRADKQVREKALEEAPRVVREASGRIADAFDRQIDAFGDRLVDFVSKLSEEMTRSIADVIRTARDARTRGTEATAQLEGETGSLMARLGAVEDRMKAQRAALWSNGREALH